jgi:hypothetical protein
MSCNNEMLNSITALRDLQRGKHRVLCEHKAGD